MKLASSRTALAALALFALATAASACGDSDDNSSAATTPPASAAVTNAPTATAVTNAPTETAAPAAGEATVMTAESDLGTILVDGDGKTLYMFMPDNQGPSTCTGGCLDAWPALVGPAVAGEGADGSLFGTAARPDDGAEQVTYNGWPLYYFAQDAAPGDINGQGASDVWFVVDPTGTPVGATANLTNNDAGY